MRTNLGRSTALALICVAAGLAGAAPASATTTIAVSGRQTVVDEAAGTYKMQGGLVGDWATTSFKEIEKSPIYRGKGTEKFTGCLDRGRDGSCAGDRTGTLSFTFLYWAKFGSDSALVWGSCWHPIVRGTGGFKGATGVLTFVDMPTASGVSTSYIGNVTLPGGSATRAHRSAPSAATRSGGCAAAR